MVRRRAASLDVCREAVGDGVMPSHGDTLELLIEYRKLLPGVYMHGQVTSLSGSMKYRDDRK